MSGSEAANSIDVNPVTVDGRAYVRVVERSVVDFSATTSAASACSATAATTTCPTTSRPERRPVRGDGHDNIYGDNGRDSLNGGPGDDTLHGWGGNDTLVGGDGFDKLYGDDGYDRLSGGGGNDWLNAGSAAEPAAGGGGWDFNAHVWSYGGARTTDINQGVAQTCDFLSSLAGVAQTGLIDLAGQIAYIGNDTYTVRLFPTGAGKTCG